MTETSQQCPIRATEYQLLYAISRNIEGFSLTFWPFFDKRLGYCILSSLIIQPREKETHIMALSLVYQDVMYRFSTVVTAVC